MGRLPVSRGADGDLMLYYRWYKWFMKRILGPGAGQALSPPLGYCLFVVIFPLSVSGLLGQRLFDYMGEGWDPGFPLFFLIMLGPAIVAAVYIEVCERRDKER